MDGLISLCALIRRFEGLRLSVYRCPAGILTIGYGHTGPDVTPKSPAISLKQAEVLLQQDALHYLKVAITLSPILLRYPTQQVAIADFCYNLGATRYKASTLRRKVHEENWQAASEEIMKWVWGGGRKLRGLMVRRAVEAKMLLSIHTR